MPCLTLIYDTNSMTYPFDIEMNLLYFKPKLFSFVSAEMYYPFVFLSDSNFKLN